MKNDNNQPKHTQGEQLFVIHDAVKRGTNMLHLQFVSHINGVKLHFSAYGKTKKEAEDNAKLIVKAVKVLSILEGDIANRAYKINPKQDAVLEYISKTIKQAEGK